MTAECENKWTEKDVDSLAASCKIREQGLNLREALELSIPTMERLCGNDGPLPSDHLHAIHMLRSLP